jgi:hypothetical protein
MFFSLFPHHSERFNDNESRVTLILCSLRLSPNASPGFGEFGESVVSPENSDSN